LDSNDADPHGGEQVFQGSQSRAASHYFVMTGGPSGHPGTVREESLENCARNSFELRWAGAYEFARSSLTVRPRSGRGSPQRLAGG